MRDASSRLLNYAHLSGLLSRCGRAGDLRLGAALHATVVKNPAHFRLCESRPWLRHVLVAWNALVAMYARCGRREDAAGVFDEMRVRDAVSWNSLLSAARGADDALAQFRRMLRSSAAARACDRATFTTVLSACGRAGAASLPACGMVHGLVVLCGFQAEVPVGNALVTAYFDCGSPGSAERVFHGMAEKNVVTWTAMISGMARAELYKESFTLFQQMIRTVDANNASYSCALLACAGSLAAREGQQVHGLVVKAGLETDLPVESGLMDVYSKCGLMEDALTVFRSCREPDEVFLTVILVGFAQNGLEEKSFELFAEMVGAGNDIDENTVSAVLGAFGASAPFALGKQIHALVIKKCFGWNIYVCNGLVNMYSKCGELRESVQVFDEMPSKNSVSWNSIISAFARHGNGSEVFQLFESMIADGAKPTYVTFLSLLHACSHIGSPKKGLEILNSMSSQYGVLPRMEHYACVVDMLGRAGLLDEAKSFIEDGPFTDSALLWQALMGACSFHGNSEVGKHAAEKLLLLDPNCTAAYVLLSNIYSSEGRWDDRAKVMKRMREMGLKKDTGKSWIELEKEVHSFVVRSTSHPDSAAVDDVLHHLSTVASDQDLMESTSL
ncbi:pentatricopeptide repeat-containing protein At3g05340 [Oryza brachyantha]|uniref:pentatricopeptide repeat-containing protein At3g05340 n=1 Tax=Oryza brachyantha TaxID=4533 RepID=UPI001ADC8578|nr:pentatricopeptide repeat-containing protein At3g05340 [Oryza brachyantha]XP_040379783.1 pentatricopeptide repeat-containing protein At3g05340 [Oryza brachyantha]XP_040379784.1 pentatricopeptide repeat-containing protein At3g05340 [Oryza brachyantha]